VNRFRRCNDEGAYAILYAVLVVVLVGIVSLVIDLGFIRSDRSANRAAADAGAIAGSQALGQGAPDPLLACKKAMRFAEASLGLGIGSDNCATIWPNATYDCTSTEQTATEVVSGRRIEVTWPVTDSNTLMQRPDLERWSATPVGQDIGATDGVACRRLAVVIAQDRSFPFSGVWNNIAHKRTSTSHSVGLTAYDFENGLEPAPLVVLDRTSCNALTVGGGGGVTVGSSADGHSGLIAVDSDGSGVASGINGLDDCNGGKKVISAPSAVNHVWALDGTDTTTGATVPARIWLYALTTPNAANAVNGNIAAIPPNGDMTNCTNQKTTATWLALGSSAPHICPVPEPGAPVTSAPWAGRYNCGGREPDLPAATSPPASANRFGCYEPDPSNPLPAPGDYIDQWVRYATGTAPAATFTNLVDNSTSATWINNCNIKEDHTFIGSTYINCSNLTTSNGVNVFFAPSPGQPGAPVVFTGSFSPSNSSCVLFNDTTVGHCTNKFAPVAPFGPDGGNIYIGGDVNFAGSSALTLNQSFLYLGGKLTIKTSGIVNWIAPYARSANPANPCTKANSAMEAPSPGCFDSLGLWSRFNAVPTGNNQDELTSSADIVVDGTLFMPRGYFKFGGGAVNTQDRAQFVALRLELRGQGELTMTPNTKRTTLIPLVVGALIR
jgi:hypothetical protein